MPNRRRGDPNRVITEFEESNSNTRQVGESTGLIRRISSPKFGSISRTQTFVISLLTAISVNIAFYYITSQ